MTGCAPVPGPGAGPEDPIARDVVTLLRAAGRTIAVAESLTGGLVAGAITAVPGASTVLRGGAVTYATDTKHALLGVDARLLAAGGPVQAQVAREMAAGVRRLFGADLGLATTGVAGPDPQAGQPVGRVFVAVGRAADAGGELDEVRMFDLAGDRAGIRAQTVRHALDLVAQVLR